MKFLKTVIIISTTIITMLLTLTNVVDTGYKYIPKYTEVVAEITAYTASIEECGKDDGITASGIKAIEGKTIAADDLPFGTKVEIDGQIYEVHDRFGSNYRNRIDVYMVDVYRASQFGRQRKVVKILGEG